MPGDPNMLQIKATSGVLDLGNTYMRQQISRSSLTCDAAGEQANSTALAVGPPRAPIQRSYCVYYSR